MKPSPLQLEWVSYPALRFEAKPVDGTAVIPTSVKARVNYYQDGHHAAELQLESAGGEGCAYDFSVHAVATFGFDLERAKDAYKCTALALSKVVATNLIRVLYSGARELLATTTARAPHGAAMIESVLIEPADVQIGSEDPMVEILRTVFGVDEETLAKIEERANVESKGEAKAEPARKVRKKAPSRKS